MPQQSGRVTIRFNSQAFRSRPGAVFQPGGKTREFAMTDQGEAYYRESFTPSLIRATMPHFADTDLIGLREYKDGTATFETDSGHVFTVANAAVANIGDLSNGEVEVTIQGDPAIE